MGATSVSFNAFTVIIDSVDIKEDLPGRRLEGSRRVHLREDAAGTEASVGQENVSFKESGTTFIRLVTSKFRGFLVNSSRDKLQIAKPRKGTRGGRPPLGRPVLTLQENTDQLIPQP